MSEDFYLKIEALLSCSSELENIGRKFRDISKPFYEDTGMLPELYAMCKTKKERYLFPIVAMILFYPTYMTGGKVPYGLRKKIVESIPGANSGAISTRLNKLRFRYLNVKSTRAETNKLLAKLYDEN